MDITPELESLRTSFIPYIEAIQKFHFHYNNPLFWVFFMILFLVLVRKFSWSHKRSFSFCVTMAWILLAMTWVEKYFRLTFVRKGEGFDPFMIRTVFFVMISIALVYFIFIDNT